MGLAMAANLQNHLKSKMGLNLVYSNRTISRGAPLEAIGAVPEPSFETLVQRCSIVFTMVSNFIPLGKRKLGESMQLTLRCYVRFQTMRSSTV